VRLLGKDAVILDDKFADVRWVIFDLDASAGVECTPKVGPVVMRVSE
jgi:hypothetical protein